MKKQRLFLKKCFGSVFHIIVIYKQPKSCIRTYIHTDRQTDRQTVRQTNMHRLCKQQNETIQHVVGSCPFISASMYLPFCHDKVAYIIYKQMLTNKQDEKVHVQEFYKDDSIEVWWDTKIKTLQKIQDNRPDIVVWKIKEKLCFIIDVSIGLDVNVDKNYELKHSSYLPLAAELKRLKILSEESIIRYIKDS